MLKEFQININKYKIIVYFFVLTALYTSIGYHFGTDDHIEHFVSIFRIISPNYLINDYFVNVNSGFGPRFYYSHLIAFLSHIAPVTVIFFILTFFSNFVIILVTYYFCKNFFRKIGFSCLLIPGFMMFFVGFNIGSSGNIWDTYLTPTSLSISFILLAVYELFIKANRLRANILLFISVLIHPILGFYGWIVLFGSLFIYNFLCRNKIKSKDLFNTILLPIIFVIFWIIPKQIFMKGSIPSQEFINIYAYFRLPHHIIPSQFPVTSYIRYLAVLSVLAILIHINWKHKLLNNNHINLRLFQLSFVSMIILIVFCTIGFLFTEIIPIKLFVIMQPFKSNSLFNWYLLITTISLSILLRCTNIKGKNILFISVLILLIIISLPYSGRYALFPFIYLIPLFWIFYFKKRVVSIFLPVVFTLVFLIFFLSSKDKLATKLRSIVHTMPTLTESCNKGNQEFITYVKNNTDSTDTFLTPPDWGAFRYCAERAIVVDIKVGSFKDLGMKEWKDRIDNCYGPVSMHGGYFGKKLEQMKNNYDNISFDKLKILNEKYHFDYVVLPINSLVNKNILFKDSKYKIIQIL